MSLLHISEITLGKFQVSTGYCNVINGSKNIKYCEFYVKILYRECCEIAKKLWFWRSIISQLFEINIL